MKHHTVTHLYINGPRGPETIVRIAQGSGAKATLTCDVCGATTVVKLPGGRVDLQGLARLEAGVQRLHQGDA